MPTESGLGDSQPNTLKNFQGSSHRRDYQPGHTGLSPGEQMLNTSLQAGGLAVKGVEVHGSESWSPTWYRCCSCCLGHHVPASGKSLHHADAGVRGVLPQSE